MPIVNLEDVLAVNACPTIYARYPEEQPRLSDSLEDELLEGMEMSGCSWTASAVRRLADESRAEQ